MLQVASARKKSKQAEFLRCDGSLNDSHIETIAGENECTHFCIMETAVSS